MMARMLMKRLWRSLRPAHASSRGRDASSAQRPVVGPRERLQSLPGFNVLVKAKHGLFVANENDIYIGRALIDYGEFSELERRLLEAYCDAGDVLLDVGA